MTLVVGIAPAALDGRAGGRTGNGGAVGPVDMLPDGAGAVGMRMSTCAPGGVVGCVDDRRHMTTPTAAMAAPAPSTYQPVRVTTSSS